MSSNALFVLSFLGALLAFLVWLGRQERKEEGRTTRYYGGVRDIYDEIEAMRVEKARADAHVRVQQDRADEVALLEQMLHGEDR